MPFSAMPFSDPFTRIPHKILQLNRDSQVDYTYSLPSRYSQDSTSELLVTNTTWPSVFTKQIIRASVALWTSWHPPSLE